ncbi:hypothetical protein KI387_026157, partial [Taxus chinensis]
CGNFYKVPEDAIIENACGSVYFSYNMDERQGSIVHYICNPESNTWSSETYNITTVHCGFCERGIYSNGSFYWMLHHQGELPEFSVSK